MRPITITIHAYTSQLHLDMEAIQDEIMQRLDSTYLKLYIKRTEDIEITQDSF